MDAREGTGGQVGGDDAITTKIGAVALPLGVVVVSGVIALVSGAALVYDGAVVAFGGGFVPSIIKVVGLHVLAAWAIVMGLLMWRNGSRRGITRVGATSAGPVQRPSSLR